VRIVPIEEGTKRKLQMEAGTQKKRHRSVEEVYNQGNAIKILG